MVIVLEDALRVAVDRELAIAEQRFSPRNFDLICLRNSRGDTLDDRRVPGGLRCLNRTGSQFASVLKAVD